MALDSALRFLWSATATHTTAFSGGAAYTDAGSLSDALAVGTTANRGGVSGIPFASGAQFIVICTHIPAVRDVIAKVWVTDGTTGYIDLGTVLFPAATGGKKVINIGMDVRPERLAAGDLLFKCSFSSVSTSGTDQGTYDCYLGYGESGDSM